jgi:hypothetical protein
VLDEAQVTSSQNDGGTLVVIIAVICAGLLLARALRKGMPKMSRITRIFVIGVGALILGGMFYGYFYNPS